MATQRKLEELYPRAPRYTIQVSDNHIVRFAHQPRGSKAMHTRIIDLSESGMAFIVPVLSAPKLDENIKIEFNAPNCDPVACFAKVVRVQKHQSYNSVGQAQVFRLIAVEFQNLHNKQREQIAQGLTQEFKNNRKKYEREQMLFKIQWFVKSVVFFFSNFFSKFWAIAFPKSKEIERSDKYIND